MNLIDLAISKFEIHKDWEEWRKYFRKKKFPLQSSHYCIQHYNTKPSFHLEKEELIIYMSDNPRSIYKWICLSVVLTKNGYIPILEYQKRVYVKRVEGSFSNTELIDQLYSLLGQ